MSFFNHVKNLSFRTNVTTLFSRNISGNTRRKLVRSKFNLLKQNQAPIADPSTISSVNTVVDEIPTKVSTFAHPLPKVVSTNTQDIINASKIFAVVDINGRQFKVTENDTLMVNHLKGTDVGDQLSFDRVLLAGGRNFTMLGHPLVPNSSVIATVKEHTTTKSINVWKYKRRTGYRKLMRYQDTVTIIEINSVSVDNIPEVPDLEDRGVLDIPESIQLI